MRLNSTIILANVCANVGDIEFFDVLLQEIEQYLAQHPNDKDVATTLDDLRKNRMMLSEQLKGFRDRLVGTWVTAEANDWWAMGTPCEVIEIKKSPEGELKAISYSHYGKKFKPQETKNLDINGENKRINIHFGTEKIKKANTALAQSLMNTVHQNAAASAATKARTGYSDWGKDMGSIIMTALASSAATSSATIALADYFLEELAPNILHGRLYSEYMYSTSNGTESSSQHTRELYLYRIIPEDDIMFSYPHNDGYWLVRFNRNFSDFNNLKKKFPKEEKMSSKKNNMIAYEKLRNKILRYVDNLDEKDAEWVTNELEYGPQGYSWNDGYYVETEADAIENKYSYDEKYKGPYKRNDKWMVVTWIMTIQDYWKGFKREENFKESFNFNQNFRGSGVPRYFKMKDSFDDSESKKPLFKKNRGKNEKN